MALPEESPSDQCKLTLTATSCGTEGFVHTFLSCSGGGLLPSKLVFGLSNQMCQLVVPVRMVMFDALGEHDDQRLGEVENLGRMRGDMVWTILRSCEISIVTLPT